MSPCKDPLRIGMLLENDFVPFFYCLYTSYTMAKNTRAGGDITLHLKNAKSVMLGGKDNKNTLKIEKCEISYF